MATKLKSLILIITLLSTSAFSEEIQEVIVLEKKLSSLNGWSSNQSISSIDQEELNKLDAQHPKQALRRSPGVWISRGSGQEHLTAIRSPVLSGPGACGSFLVLEDGLPIRPTGFCNVNGLFETFFEMSSGLETITGPASARYGANAMHGVINVLSEPIDSKNKLYTNIGPNNYKNLKLRAGNKKNWSLDGFFASNGGFRELSGYDQQKARIQSNFSIANWNASLKTTLTNLNQETAGYINGLDSYKDKSFSKRNFNSDAYRDAKSQRISLRLTREKGDKLISITPYIRNNDMQFFQHFLPGTPLEENSHRSMGVVVQSIKDHEFYNLISGFQFDLSSAELTETQKDALTTSSAFNNATRPKGKHYDYEVDSIVYAIFGGIEDFYLNENLSFFADARAEFIEYDYSNKMISGNTREDGSKCGFGGCYYNRPSDRSDNFDETSARAGIETNFERVNYFAQVSLGFRPPQINEAYRLQKKQTTSDLSSETLTMFEVGSQFDLNTITGSISLYQSKKKNSIFRDAENFIVDNGKTDHQGVELSLNWTINTSSRLISNITYGNHKYDFETDTSMREKIRTGNYIDTAPKLMANLIWDIALFDNSSLAFEIEHMGPYYTDAANLHEYEGHTLYHSRFSQTLSDSMKYFLRIDNLFDKAYAERADFNAFGGDRYFPGLPREVYIGLEYTF
ncbi:MAG: TonB-dependent receptor [Gammaproteobacteria bacterium]|nr:MAG: TonB-dependent receptor [Gammaproteobacteria bacterium]